MAAIEWTHLLDLENITGDDLGSLNFEKTTITENNSLQGKSLLQFFDDRTSLKFLNETNTSIEKQEGADDTKVNPILKTGSENGSSLYDFG